jgi:hypothetical protein
VFDPIVVLGVANMGIETANGLSVSLLQTWPVRVDASGERATPVAPAPALDEAAAAVIQRAQQSLIAGHLRIELDQEAGRFVQTLTDAHTMEVLRSFPYESQLAFARAIGAYMNAKAETL